MSSRILVTAAALLGGVCWVAHMFVDAGALVWLGMVLLGLALAVVGAGLVRAPWVRAVAAAGSVALAGGLVELGRNTAEDRVFLGIVGGSATLVVAATVVLRPRGNP